MSYIVLYTQLVVYVHNSYTNNTNNTYTQHCVAMLILTLVKPCVAAIHAQQLLTNHSISALAVHVLLDEGSSNMMIAHLCSNSLGISMIIPQNCTSQNHCFVEPSRWNLVFASALGLTSTICSIARRG